MIRLQGLTSGPGGPRRNFTHAIKEKEKVLVRITIQHTQLIDHQEQIVSTLTLHAQPLIFLILALSFAEQLFVEITRIRRERVEKSLC